MREVARALLPAGLRQGLRRMHQELVLRRAMSKVSTESDSLSDPGHPIIQDLIYGWANEGWSGSNEYLAACVGHAAMTTGPILECGSGLSTLILGAVAKGEGRPLWALEHMPRWAQAVQGHVDRHGLETTTVSVAPLHDYGEFEWYDPPLAEMPERFSLVVCDGPPSAAKGGRYGLVPVMRERMAPGCTILLDDANRKDEVDIARRWGEELEASFEILGDASPWIRMVI